MRAVSCANVLILFAAQFYLLRTSMSAGLAVLVLLVWQMLCYLNNLGNAQYYCVAYFYSQAVGMLGVWLGVALYARPSGSAVGRLMLGTAAILLAGFAYLCHIVPGVPVFGAFGLYSLLRFCRRPNFDDAFRLLVLALVGSLVLFGTAEFGIMSKGRSVCGWVPLKNYVIQLTWVPTLLFAFLWCWRTRRENHESDWGGRVCGVLVCLLVTAGGLQAYCADEWRRGVAVSYAALKFFYILFPVCSLLWCLWAVRWARQTPLLGRWQEAIRRWRAASGVRGWCVPGVAAVIVGLLVFLQMRIFVHNELIKECPASERHPVLVARELARSVGKQGDGGLIYFDPQLPQSSVYVNMVGLGRSMGDAYDVVNTLRDWKPGREPVPAELKQKVHFSKLLLPGALTGSGYNAVSSRR
jgi:hypothetical protein